MIWDLFWFLMNNVLWKWWCHWSKILPGNRRCLIVPVSADKMVSHFASFRNDKCRHGISVFPCRTWRWICNVISMGWLVETRQKFSLKWVHDFYWLKAFVQNFERKFRGHNGKFSLPFHPPPHSGPRARAPSVHAIVRACLWLVLC